MGRSKPYRQSSNSHSSRSKYGRHDRYDKYDRYKDYSDKEWTTITFEGDLLEGVAKHFDAWSRHTQHLN